MYSKAVYSGRLIFIGKLQVLVAGVCPHAPA